MAGNGGFLQMTIQSLAYMSPLLLVYFIGLVIAITNYGKHPKPALYVLLAMIGLLVVSLLVAFVRNYMIAEGNFGAPLTAIGIFGSICEALCYGLLVAAAFAARKGKEQRRDDYDDDRDDRDDRPRAVAKPLRQND